MMGNGLLRTRWAAIGAAVAVSLGGGVVWVANAAGTGTVSSYVPIVPCRLADTRAVAPVGARNTPISGGESAVFQVTGSNGDCTIPSTATGIVSNITAVNPNAGSFLAVFPADAPFPKVSNLNWTIISPPTPNMVTTGLSADGAIKAFNHTGKIDIVIDIMGYYQPSTSGPSGPAGPAGPRGLTGATGAAGTNGTNGTNGVDGAPGAAGAPGAKGIDGTYGAPGAPGAPGAKGIDGTNGAQGAPGTNGAAGAPGTPGINGIKGIDGLNGLVGAQGPAAWNTIPSGQTVTGSLGYDTHQSGTLDTDVLNIDLPASTATPLTAATVNFDGASLALDSPDGIVCTGTLFAPTAPPGQLCIYLDASGGVDMAQTYGDVGLLPLRSFIVVIKPAADPLNPLRGVPNADEYISGTWAYTAPTPTPIP